MSETTRQADALMRERVEVGTVVGKDGWGDGDSEAASRVVVSSGLPEIY